MKRLFAFAFLLSVTAFADTNPDLPNPELLTKKYLEELSKREIGQTKFVIKQQPRSYAPNARGSAESTSADSRDIQESDVFKIGKAGKKELFLLNNYRGFQVISFEEGIEQPKIKGRFPVYNNWSSEMYYLEKQDQVLVINTEWSHRQNYWSTNYNTKLYLLDVSNTEEPKLVKEIDVPGYLQQSRMVGDVLYTITNNGSWNQLQARVTSVKITSNSLQSIESQELNSNQRWISTMNVVKSGDKYLIIATLTDWGAKGDLINVLDITSSKGDIEKLFTAKARGQISERSETFIHKDHLFAVSNYTPSNGERRRISVEAFPLVKSDVIVESKESMRISVGDTNGQHASLQDVRVSGDLLYTFWVPANNIDPFDLFDISNPAKGIKHLGQLQFDGWISKAFPIEFQDKKFVLGLGWIVPVTSENGNRYPQAKLFEIKKVNDTYQHSVVTSLTLDSSDVWASLNNLDKYFEILEDAPGVFNVMFPVTFRKGWKSGAKIVNVDLNKAQLSEGASIIGEQSWLKRVFVNSEIDAINTFGELSLGTFNQSDISNNIVAKSVSILELARNILDFQVLSNKEGLQIVNADKKVELRVVSLEKSDAEQNEVLSTLFIKGNYHWHKVKNGKLLMITSINKVVSNENEYYPQEKFESAYLNIVDLKTMAMSKTLIEIKLDQDENRYFYFQVLNTSTQEQELFRIAKQMFRLDGEKLSELEITSACQYFFKEGAAQLHALKDSIFAYNTFNVKAIDANEGSEPRPYYEYTTYSMPFIKQLMIENNQVACATSVNVPGSPELIKDQFLIATEGYSYGIRPMYNYEYFPMRYWPGYRMNSKTFSLKLAGNEAELVDIVNKDITNTVLKDSFVTYTPTESRIDFWSISSEGEFMSKAHFLNYSAETSSIVAVKTLNNRDLVIMKNNTKVDLYEVTKNHRMTKLDVTSSFDQNKEDGSAEFIFAIENMSASPDLSKIFISQGLYGITEIILK